MPKFIVGLLIIIIGVSAFQFYTSVTETPPIWKTTIEDKIYSESQIVNGNVVFLAGNKSRNLYKLYELDRDGKQVCIPKQLPNFPYDPLIVGKTMVVADKARMVRGFGLPGLNIEWEVGSNDPLPMGPKKCGKDNFIQASGKSAVYCFEAKSGKQLWDIQLYDDFRNYACDKVIIIIHGYPDQTSPMYKCTAYDLEEGMEIWTLKEVYVSAYNPVFVKNFVVLSTPEGEVLLVDQLSGEIKFRNGKNGFIPTKGFEDGCLMVSKDYSTAAYLSLQTGNSWTVPLTKELIGAAQIGSRVMIADKENLICYDADLGETIWKSKLGDIYEAYEYRNGIFVSYKDYFTARETYGAYIEANSSKNVWTAIARGTFKRPCPTNIGDFLICQDGSVRMMPKPKTTSSSNMSLPVVTMPDPMAKDPTEKINKAFNEKAAKAASPTAGIQVQKQETKKQADNEIPKELAPVSDEDAGW